MCAEEMRKGVFKAICNNKMDIDTIYFCLKVSNQVKRDEMKKESCKTPSKNS